MAISSGTEPGEELLHNLKWRPANHDLICITTIQYSPYPEGPDSQFCIQFCSQHIAY